MSNVTSIKGRSSSLSEAHFDRNVKENNKPVTTSTWCEVLGEGNSLGGRGYWSAGVESRLQSGEGNSRGFQRWKRKLVKCYCGRDFLQYILVILLRYGRNAGQKLSLMLKMLSKVPMEIYWSLCPTNPNFCFFCLFMSFSEKEICVSVLNHMIYLFHFFL